MRFDGAGIAGCGRGGDGGQDAGRDGKNLVVALDHNYPGRLCALYTDCAMTVR